MKRYVVSLVIMLLSYLFNGATYTSQAGTLKPFITVKAEYVSDQLIKVTVPEINNDHKERVYEVTLSNVTELLKNVELYTDDWVIGFEKRYHPDYMIVLKSLAEFHDWLKNQNWKGANVAGMIGAWCFLSYAMDEGLIDGDTIQIDIVLWDLSFERGKQYSWHHNTDNKNDQYWTGNGWWGVAVEIQGFPKIIPEIYSGAGYKTKFKLQKSTE